MTDDWWGQDHSSRSRKYKPSRTWGHNRLQIHLVLIYMVCWFLAPVKRNSTDHWLHFCMVFWNYILLIVRILYSWTVALGKENPDRIRCALQCSECSCAKLSNSAIEVLFWHLGNITYYPNFSMLWK